jgi:hypothetical protein
MSAEPNKSYLTDITTSEGNLSRLSTMCQTIARVKVHDLHRLYEIIEKEIGLTNYKVIGRHLHILGSIGLIEKTLGTYLITSRGKALVKLRSQNPLRLLSGAEKVIFFKSFFNNVFEQLYWVIYTIRRNEGATSEKNSLDYFYSSAAKSIWLDTLQHAAKKGSNGKQLTRGMINKFDTMIYWLSHLDIVRKGNRLWLTEKGMRLLDDLSKNDNVKKFSSVVYYLATQLYSEHYTRRFNISEDRNEFIRVLREGSRLFRGEQNLSDVVAIQEFASAVFATGGIALEENNFYETAQALGLNGTIKSIILGRDGKPAFLVMD